MIHRMRQWSQCHEKINNELKVVYFRTFSGNGNLLEKLIFLYSNDVQSIESGGCTRILRHDAETLDEIMHKEVLL